MKEIHHPNCTCSCHQDGRQVRHCEPCCSYTYQKFIDKDGNVDIIRFNDLVREKQNRQAPYIDGGEYVVKNKYNHDSTQVKDKRK